MARPFRRKPRQPTLPGMAVPRRGRRGARERTPRPRPSISRRQFLARTLGWVTGAIAAMLGIPAVVAAVAPALRREEDQWSPVGRLGEPEGGEPDLAVQGRPHLTHFTSLVEDAYLRATPRDAAVYVVNHGGGRFTVFDVRCTHLGCPVTWEEADQEFFCPCHAGVFDAQGRVVAGPPPRPLDRFEFKVEEGVLFAGALYEVNEELERATS